MAIIEHGYKNYSNAISYLQEAIDIQPDDSDLWLLLKQCYIGMGEIEKAEMILMQAYQHFPNSYRILTDYASFLYSKDEQDLWFLEEILIKSFKLNSDYIPTRALLASTLIFLNKREEDIDFAIRLLEKTLKVLSEEDKAFYTKHCLNLLEIAHNLKKS